MTSTTTIISAIAEPDGFSPTELERLSNVTLQQWDDQATQLVKGTRALVASWFLSGLGNQAQLAERLGLSKAAISKQVKRLVLDEVLPKALISGQGKRTDLKPQLESTAPEEKVSDKETATEAEPAAADQTVEVNSVNLPEDVPEPNISKAERLLADAKARKVAADERWDAVQQNTQVMELTAQLLKAQERTAQLESLNETFHTLIQLKSGQQARVRVDDQWFVVRRQEDMPA